MAIAYTTSYGLPVASDGTLQNSNGVSGGQKGSNGFHINSNGTVATNTVKNGSAFINSFGWLQNPDDSIVVSVTKQGGAFINSHGVLQNPDGTTVNSTTKSGAFLNFLGILVNA